MKTLPLLKKDIHKGDAGRILLIGGSIGMSGSILLATKAALRVGAGLAYVAVPQDIGPIVDSQSLESMTIYCDSDKGQFGSEAWEQIKDKAIEANVILVGPGMGQGLGAQKLLNELQKLKNKRIVVDADALNLISQHQFSFQSEVVFTPHIGEMKRLDRGHEYNAPEQYKELALGYCSKENICLVLKNHKTLVVYKDRIYTESAGNPGMATGGMGDVLAGTIAGLLLNQTLSVFDLTCIAVHLHSYTADEIIKSSSMRSLLPGDLINWYPQTLQRFEADRSE